MILRLSMIIVSSLTIICQVEAKESLIWNLTCVTSENVTRAVGANFSVQIDSPCRSDAIGCRIGYAFYENTKDTSLGQNMITVNFTRGPVSATEVYQEQGATTYYSYKKTSDNKMVKFKLEMVPENRRVAMIFLAKSNFQHCSTFQFATVTFTGCQNTTNFNIILQKSSSNLARYLDTGDIICNRDGKGRAIYENGSEALSTYCNADANWKDADDISCLYPINATLLICDSSCNETKTLRYNETAGSQTVNLKCDPGLPNSSHFMLGDNDISASLSIRPEDNGMNISCYVENNFTDRFGVNKDIFATAALDIEFGPTPPPEYTKLCSFNNGSIPFYSNPSISEASLIFENGTGINISTRLETCCEQNYGVQGQMIVLNDSSLDVFNMYLQLKVFEISINYTLVPCENVTETTTTRTMEATTVPLSSTQSEGQGLPVTILIAIIAAGVGLVLIIFIVILCWKRGCKGKQNSMSRDDKVDTVNPLYGTSYDVSPGDSAREEHDNPLYASSQVPDDNGATYAEVDRKMKGAKKMSQEPAKTGNDMYASVDNTKKKKNAKGKENSAFVGNEQNDATYSVVDKKQKQKDDPKSHQPGPSDASVYAAVDHSKKKDKKGGKGSGKHDDSDTTETYAEVNKKNKKDKGNSNSDRPKASDADTYAAVDLSKKKDKNKSGGSQTQTTPEVDTTYAEVNKKNKKK